MYENAKQGARSLAPQSPLINPQNVPFIDQRNAMGMARAFAATHPWRLAQLNEQWWLWDGTRYRPIVVKQLEAEVWKWLEAVGAFTPTPKAVGNLLRALAAVLKLPPGTAMPVWLGSDDLPGVEHVVPFSNGLLDVSGEEFKLRPHSPLWLSENCLPHPYHPDAPCPIWMHFLDEVFEGDEERERALQMWIGYQLTCDTRQQRFAVFVGPPGSGKSTVLRVIGDLLGHENVATPTLTTLQRFFGMETINGKMAALIGDAQLETNEKAVAVLEKLKSVVGADRQNVDRKGRAELANVVVHARFTIAANELPQLPDYVNALRRRMLVIPFNRSFAGREDLDLGDKLSAELSGIAAWAVRGLKDLRQAGRLLQPRAGLDAIEDYSRLNSPIQEFIEERCVLAADAVIPCGTLWAAWREWCQVNGYTARNNALFGKMLKSFAPGVERVRKGRNDGSKQVRCYSGIDLVRASPAPSPDTGGDPEQPN